MIAIKLMRNQVTNMTETFEMFKEKVRVAAEDARAEMAAMGCLDILKAMGELEAMKGLSGLDAKVLALGRHGMTLADGFFYGVFTEAEESLLFELERRGYLTTGIVRLLG